MWNELINALAKVVGFLRVLPFPPTGNIAGQGGLTTTGNKQCEHILTSASQLYKLYNLFADL
jgi:hypothetical protein